MLLRIVILLVACIHGSSAARGNNNAPIISYVTSTPIFTTGIAVNMPPTVKGNIYSYRINPAFPLGSGLSFSGSTGRISGTPLAPAPSTAYTVTATGLTGSGSTILRISVMKGATVATTEALPTTVTVRPSALPSTAASPSPTTSATVTPTSSATTTSSKGFALLNFLPSLVKDGDGVLTNAGRVREDGFPLLDIQSSLGSVVYNSSKKQWVWSMADSSQSSALIEANGGLVDIVARDTNGVTATGRFYVFNPFTNNGDSDVTFTLGLAGKSTLNKVELTVLKQSICELVGNVKSQNVDAIVSRRRLAISSVDVNGDANLAAVSRISVLVTVRLLSQYNTEVAYEALTDAAASGSLLDMLIVGGLGSGISDVTVTNFKIASIPTSERAQVQGGAGQSGAGNSEQQQQQAGQAILGVFIILLVAGAVYKLRLYYIDRSEKSRVMRELGPPAHVAQNQDHHAVDNRGMLYVMPSDVGISKVRRQQKENEVGLVRLHFVHLKDKAEHYIDFTIPVSEVKAQIMELYPEVLSRNAVLRLICQGREMPNELTLREFGCLGGADIRVVSTDH